MRPTTTLVRTAIIFALVRDSLAYMSETSIPSVAKAKAQAAKGAVEQLNQALNSDYEAQDRIVLIDTAIEQIAAVNSSMNPIAQIMPFEFSEQDQAFVYDLVERFRAYCNENGIALKGNNPFHVAVRKLHLILAVAGENKKTMWQQVLVQAIQNLLVEIRNTITTQQFAGSAFDVTYPEFLAAPAVENQVKGQAQAWTQPTTAKATSSRRELATAGAQA